jgi:Arc/MetJ-type ribon-helix-helix transcriptional regulator
MSAATTAKPIALRLPAALRDRVDRHRERLGAAVPGVPLTRSDALRALLTAALDVAEVKAARRQAA